MRESGSKLEADETTSFQLPPDVVGRLILPTIQRKGLEQVAEGKIAREAAAHSERRSSSAAQPWSALAENLQSQTDATRVQCLNAAGRPSSRRPAVVLTCN